MFVIKKLVLMHLN